MPPVLAWKARESRRGVERRTAEARNRQASRAGGGPGPGDRAGGWSSTPGRPGGETGESPKPWWGPFGRMAAMLGLRLRSSLSRRHRPPRRASCSNPDTYPLLGARRTAPGSRSRRGLWPTPTVRLILLMALLLCGTLVLPSAVGSPAGWTELDTPLNGRYDLRWNGSELNMTFAGANSTVPWQHEATSIWCGPRRPAAEVPAAQYWLSTSGNCVLLAGYSGHGLLPYPRLPLPPCGVVPGTWGVKQGVTSDTYTYSDRLAEGRIKYGGLNCSCWYNHTGGGDFWFRSRYRCACRYRHRCLVGAPRATTIIRDSGQVESGLWLTPVVYQPVTPLKRGYCNLGECSTLRGNLELPHLSYSDLDLANAVFLLACFVGALICSFSRRRKVRMLRLVLLGCIAVNTVVQVVSEKTVCHDVGDPESLLLNWYECGCHCDCDWNSHIIRAANQRSTGSVCVPNGWATGGHWGTKPQAEDLRALGYGPGWWPDHGCATACTGATDTVQSCHLSTTKRIIRIEIGTHTGYCEGRQLKAVSRRFFVRPPVWLGEPVWCDSKPPILNFDINGLQAFSGPSPACKVTGLADTFGPKTVVNRDCTGAFVHLMQWWNLHCGPVPGIVGHSDELWKIPECVKGVLCTNGTHTSNPGVDCRHDGVVYPAMAAVAGTGAFEQCTITSKVVELVETRVSEQHFGTWTEKVTSLADRLFGLPWWMRPLIGPIATVVSVFVVLVLVYRLCLLLVTKRKTN